MRNMGSTCGGWLGSGGGCMVVVVLVMRWGN